MSAACRSICKARQPLVSWPANLLRTPISARIPQSTRLSDTRWMQTHRQFQPLTPPNPSSLPKPRAVKHYRRTRKWLRRFFWASTVSGVVLAFDYQFNASALIRSARTFGLGLLVGLDYKINFRAHPPFANSIEDVHYRSAERLFNLLRANGGLYLKIGQAIAMQSAILPPEFQKMFARMFDDAPQNDWADVERVIREDFGKSPEEAFGVSFHGDPSKGLMERTARASASVAQVHWARLQDGREVALKIQKREIAKQVGWDLWSFKVIARFYTWWFDLPFYTLVPFITERLMLECDFENEADNSEMMRKLVQGEPRLRGRVYIPQVYRELSSKRVMTTEWIEGTRLWDKEAITSRWQGGWRKGTPGCHGTPLDAPGSQSFKAAARASSGTKNNNLIDEKLKPQRDQWKGPNGKGGLGLSMKDVMGTMVDLFSAQMFLWGVVHCDPHPGNIFVRRQPSGKAELVLIDHGLYIQMDPTFRHQYALLWKSLMTFDNKTIGDIVTSWGIGNADAFASATLMRPYEGGDHSFTESFKRELEGLSEQEKAYHVQEMARKNVRELLLDDTKLPKELIWIGRNLRIVQGNNQFLGSPVNRIKITGNWASRALVESKDLSFSERLGNYGRHLVFKFVMLGSDFVFYYSKIKQMLGLGGGMEDDLEQQMRGVMKEMGVELNHSVFDG